MTFPSLFEKGKKNGHQRWTGWWHHLRSCQSHLNFISLKAKDSGRFTSAYHNAAGPLSSMEQACENMIRKYIFLRDVRPRHRWGNIWWKSAYRACLISLRQFLKSKVAEKEKKRRCGEQPQVIKPQDCCSCQTHTAGVTQNTQPEPSPWKGEHR